MANWLEQAFGLSDEAASDASTPKRRTAPDTRSCWVVVRQPSGAGDYGETVACHYIVDGDTLTLCDQDGKPTGEPHMLAPGESARAVAGRLKRDAWKRESGRSDFNGRRLTYGPLGLA